MALLCLQTCSEKMAGAGSETTNGIVGCVVNDNGSPAANAMVLLLPADYDPVSTIYGNGDTVTTDVRGRFVFKRPVAGTYTVLAKSSDRSLHARISDITINDADTATSIDSCHLATPGTVVVDFSGFAGHTGGYCYLPGTDIYAKVDTSGIARLVNVPAGIFAKIIHVSSADNHIEVLRHDVSVYSMSCVNITNPGWKYTRSLVLNTTASGAGIMDNLFDVPVLLRLNRNNFNFTQSQVSGTDLLFTGSNNRPVPFEIDQWDSSANVAAVWLLIDTLRGNSDSDTISMFWGNEEARSLQVHGSVFDTAAGFEGVWHLGNTPGDSALDATVNFYNGGSTDSTWPQSVSGLIGNAGSFNGTSSYISMPNTARSQISFPQNGCYTVSAWVFVGNSDQKSHVIVSKGNAQYFLWYTSIHQNATLWEFADYRSESGWDLAIAPVNAGEWVFVAGVRDGTSHMLYINGERVDTLIDFPFNITRSNQSDLMIGRFAQIMASPGNDEGYCYFNGLIDEVQISSIARSAEWIRLAYRNQGNNDKMVMFK